MACLPTGMWPVTVTGHMPVGKQAILFAYGVPDPVRFAEVPYVFRPRLHGKSKLDILVALEYLELLADKVVAIATLLVLSAVAAAVVSHGRLSAAGIGRDLRWVGLVAVVAVGLALATRRLAARADAMGRFGAARRFARGVHRGLSALREPRCVLYGATFGIAGWLAEVCVIHILCSSLGISLGTAAIVLAVAALNLGIAIPLSMANLGAYEAALTFGLTRWGVPIAPAIAVALAHHAIEITGIACTAGLTSIARSWAPRRRRRAGRSRDE